jgi:serine protease inhibitor
MMKSFAALLVCVMSSTVTLPGRDPSDAQRALAAPYAQFGFDLLRELSAAHRDTNLFISPASIAVALAMTSNGAQGATRDAILKTLHADSLPIDAFNAANRALVAELGHATSVQLSIANALWLEQGFPIEPSFQQILEKDYSAQAENVDFRNPATLQTINGWVARQTGDRIPKLLDQIDPSTLVMLTNAVAFKGKWTLPFDPKATQPHDFNCANGKVLSVPMMNHSAEYAYAGANGLEAIRLPYTDGAFAMYVILPKDAGRMQSFIDQLTPEVFTNLTMSLQTSHGTIELPRFTIKFGATLNTALRTLGMGIAFGDTADFAGIQKSRQLQISEVRHASFLRVDEEGTEAAAATSIGIRPLAMRVEPPPFHMVVDHPFFVAIRDERSGQILFTGRIDDPER